MNMHDEIAQALKSTAYHEAGHIVAAVLQGMPIQHGGIHIDMEGSGVAYYCHRLPGVPGHSESDRDEREKTIVALYAGRIAQFKSFPNIDCRDYPDSWKSDWETAAELLHELLSFAQGASEMSLYARAQQLVLNHWPTIERLALMLWEKPILPMQQSEFQKGWSHGREKQEKYMSRSEIQSFFEILNIPCPLWEKYRAQ